MLSENAIRVTLYPKVYHASLVQPGAAGGFAHEAPHPQRACGKAIIVGEHAVVYGAEAIAMPVPSLAMELSLRRAPLGGDRPPCSLGDSRAPEPIAAVVDDAFRLLAIKPFPVRIEGHSAILIGSGLGSSAALCVVILKALAASQKRNLSIHQLATLANELEKRFHGTPSGLDTAVVAFQNIISFRRQGSQCDLQPLPVAPLDLDEGEGAWHFALIDSRVRSSTLAMITLAAPYFAGSAGELRLSRFDRLAAQVKAGLAAGAQADVAAAMAEAGLMLGESGVTTPLLDEMVGLCQRLGIPAAKPTGAGGGGCVLTLLDAAQWPRQLAALQEHFGKARVVKVAIQPSLPTRLNPAASLPEGH